MAPSKTGPCISSNPLTGSFAVCPPRTLSAIPDSEGIRVPYASDNRGPIRDCRSEVAQSARPAEEVLRRRNIRLPGKSGGFDRSIQHHLIGCSYNASPREPIRSAAFDQNLARVVFRLIHRSRTILAFETPASRLRRPSISKGVAEAWRPPRRVMPCRLAGALISCHPFCPYSFCPRRAVAAAPSADSQLRDELHVLPARLDWAAEPS